MEYWRAKQLEQDLARLDKDFGDEPEDMLIVCDRGEAGPPPPGWKPDCRNKEGKCQRNLSPDGNTSIPTY
jgi:hypothetical protein